VSVKSSGSNDSSEEAYSILGLQKGASFEQVQRARDEKLAETADDPLLKAKIESSYDSLLMDSLKARQLGKISNEAMSASKKENISNEIGSFKGSSLLTRFKLFNKNKSQPKTQIPSSKFNQFNSQSSLIKISLGMLSVVILLISPDQSIQIILSLSTLAVFISQARSGRGFLQSLGWSVVFLSTGLIVGGLLATGPIHLSDQTSNFTPDKIEAIVALIFIWIGSLFK